MVRKAQAIDKARRFENQLAKQKWDKFKELLIECGYPIKKDNGYEMFLRIEGEVKADIELFRVTNSDEGFVHIQLWYYTFNSKKLNEKYKEKSINRYSSVTKALNYINRMYDDIKNDKRYG